jgi:enoyl-CoA hydratase/carnithine racemase
MPLTVSRLPELPSVLRLTFDDPPTLNSLTKEIYLDIIDNLRAARLDDTVSAVMFAGAGDRAFSSGLSMKELDKATNDSDRRAYYTLGHDIREAIFALTKPIIAAVHGQCVGGGFEIALCCDLIYASEGSSFLLPEVNIGLTPGNGGAINLAAKLPLNRAMEILWFSERVSVDEMHRWGLVNKIFPAETFEQDVVKCLDKLLSKPQFAIRGVKRILSHTAVFGDQSESLKCERELAADTMNTEDFREAVTAFHEKRKPVFTGK